MKFHLLQTISTKFICNLLQGSLRAPAYVTADCSRSQPYYLKQRKSCDLQFYTFPYLSPTPPENKHSVLYGKSFSRPAAYRIHRNLTSPWFSPSRPKAEVSLFCDGSLLWEKLSTHLPSTYRSFPQREIIAFVTDVAHHHRNVTEECVLNFQRSLTRGCLACLQYNGIQDKMRGPCRSGLVDLSGLLLGSHSNFGRMFPEIG